MSANATHLAISKPASVRIIFILNAVKILLSLGFYLVFTQTSVSIEGFDPNKILYTGAAYAVLFGLMVYCINARKLWGLRIAIVLDFIASIPVTAVVGMIISIASLVVSFRASAKAYFGQ